MKQAAGLLILVLLAGCRGSSNDPAEQARAEFGGLRLESGDGTTVFAEQIQTDSYPVGVVLLFHQAGSNMHEYDPIAKRVAKYGWHSLKVDQRSGGESWGEINLTASQFDQDQSFLDAYQDMEAALDWAESQGYEKIVAWGSSYSASLAFRLAAENDSVDGVVSFSPGEYERLYEKGTYTEDGSLVADWNSKVEVPCFIAATAYELLKGVDKIVEAAPDLDVRGRDVNVGTSDGVHGSSTLREDKNATSSEFYWERLANFLKDIESDGKAFGG